jgi:hypothetical protein
MAVSIQAELIRALESGDYNAIKDTRENEWLDFKSQPYDLSSPTKIADLAADVAAFANGQGGYLLIGVQESPLPDSQETAASNIRGVPGAMVNENQIRKLIRAHVRPLVQIELRRFPIEDRELVLIEVRPLEVYDRPAIVDRVTPPDGERPPANAIGWPIRHGADTYWETAGRIQQLLNNGLRPDGDGVLVHGTGGPPPGDPATTHLDLLDEQEGWEDWPRLAIQAIPEAPANPIVDFYGAFSDAIVRWQNIRPMGFGLGLDYFRLENRGTTVVSADDRRFVAIDRTGVLTAAANGTPAMLGWSRHEHTSWSDLREIRTNPVVLVEFFAEAVRFVEAVLVQEVNARRWRFKVIGQRLQRPTPLVLDMTQRSMFPSHQHPPTVDEFTQFVDMTGDPGRDAFSVISEMIGPGWGVGQQEIPFVVDHRIDISLIGQK